MSSHRPTEPMELRHGIGAFVLDKERHPGRRKEVSFAKNLVRTALEKLRKRGFASDEIRRFVQAEFNLNSEPPF